MADGFSSNGKAGTDWRFWLGFGALVAISVVVRLIVVLNSRARASYDTPSYLNAATAIATLDFSRYDGRRTPAYPAHLVLAGMDYDNMRLIQALLGIAIAAMLFAITLYRTRNAIVSFIVGLFGSLALMELLYEQIIYSETLCTFWVVLSVLAYGRIQLRRHASWWDYALLGLTAALAGMTRPMFLYLGPLYLGLMMMEGHGIDLRRLRDARPALILAPTLLLALGWSMVNKYTIDYFGVTTTTGFNLSNHSGAFMELAPAKYAQIAQIYLRYRTGQMEKLGSQTMTIWYAEGEIERKTGLSPAELSKQLTRMSLEMFAQHPLLYLESVCRGWVRFWGTGIYAFVRTYPRRSVMYRLLFFLGTLQLAINGAFLAISGYSIARLLMKRASFDFELGVIAIVLVASLVQAFMEYGENVRYLAPVAPLMTYVVATSIWRALKIAKRYRQLTGISGYVQMSCTGVFRCPKRPATRKRALISHRCAMRLLKIARY